MHDPVKVYVATGYENRATARAVMDVLEEYGWVVTYDWTASEGPPSREMADAEAAGVAEADALVVLLPGGRGTHVELGIAVAMRKLVLLFVADDAELARGGEVCPFYLRAHVTICRTGATPVVDVLRWILNNADKLEASHV